MDRTKPLIPFGCSERETTKKNRLFWCWRSNHSISATGGWILSKISLRDSRVMLHRPAESRRSCDFVVIEFGRFQDSRHFKASDHVDRALWNESKIKNFHFLFAKKKGTKPKNKTTKAAENCSNRCGLTAIIVNFGDGFRPDLRLITRLRLPADYSAVLYTLRSELHCSAVAGIVRIFVLAFQSLSGGLSELPNPANSRV